MNIPSILLATLLLAGCGGKSSVEATATTSSTGTTATSATTATTVTTDDSTAQKAVDSALRGMKKAEELKKAESEKAKKTDGSADQ